MAKLLRKVASRLRRGKSADGSWYTDKYQTIRPLGTCTDGTSPSANSDDMPFDQHSKLKTWTNRLKKTARRKDLIPADSSLLVSTSPTNSTTALSCTLSSRPASTYLDTLDSGTSTKQQSVSETTAEIDPEFGFSMRRMRGDFGMYHDKDTPPRLYLDLPRQSDTFSPFRPFSPTFFLPALDTSETSLRQRSARYFSTASVDRYRSISASLAAAPVPVAAPADSSSTLPLAKNRFYSQSNLDALGVTRAPTADSGLSPRSVVAGSPPPYSVRSFSSSSQSRTMRSLSASLLSRNDGHSIKSPIGSRVTSPSYSLASPISFC